VLRTEFPPVHRIDRQVSAQLSVVIGAFELEQFRLFENTSQVTAKNSSIADDALLRKTWLNIAFDEQQEFDVVSQRESRNNRSAWGAINLLGVFMTFRISSHKLRTTLCAIVGLFALAPAQSETVICENCDQATMQTEAIALGIGTQYVVDVVNNVVRKFDVSGRCIKDRETGSQECFGTSAIERAVEQEVIDYITTVHLLSKTVISIPANISGNNTSSAYNALSTPAGRAAVQNFVNNSVGTSALGRPPYVDRDFNIVYPSVTVQFSESSTAVYEFHATSFGEPIGSFELKPNSALDAAGNPVIFGVRDFASEDGSGREFDFGSGGTGTRWGAYFDFLAAAQRWGVPTVGAASSRLRLSCVKVGNGNWECRYI
jgi:hypothetical protein